jgi:hypothetical protein
MSIWILQNQYAAQAWADLRRICPDPGLSMDAAGRVTYRQSASGFAFGFIAAVSSSNVPVGIRGENPRWSAKPEPGWTLADKGGVTAYGKPPSSQVDIAYDVTDCDGRGSWTIDRSGNRISSPPYVVMFHELTHALEAITGSLNENDFETSAVAQENQYRASIGLALRFGHDGRCNAPAGGGGGGGTGGGGAGGGEIRSRAVVPASICLGTVLTAGYRGPEHVVDVAAVPPASRSYRVYVTNATAETFSEIVIFYKRRGLPGVVYLSERDVGPGRVIAFLLGDASSMESYVVGFFLDGDLVQQIPTSGNMTPALASMLNPTDADPCLDAWLISDQ